MAYLGTYYRTYALDFWGFGESGKKRETYAVQDFVSLVDQFMEQLGHRPRAAGWAQHGRHGQPFGCHPLSRACQQGGGGGFTHCRLLAGAPSQTGGVSRPLPSCSST
ncbi:MAG: hypothetical protein MZV64_19685 [Ignavibacteriales bacterium]|nr:hypothetical protein [Ignavibacteriales bacterium]